MSDAAAEPKRKAPEPEDESGKMSFLDHLDELRKRLVHIAIYLGVGFIVSWFFARRIYNFLAIPITQSLPEGTKLAYTNPTDPFTLYMKVALLSGIFLTLPLTLYEIWKFIAPGLYRREKAYVLPFLFFSILLFLSGAAFCYTVVLPTAFKFLVNLGSSFTPMIRINEYLDLTNMMLLGFGLIFEMPVIAAFLSMFGLISARFLWKKFNYALVAIVLLAAIISPTGDALNLFWWSAPMVVLYLISIGVAAIFGWRRRRKGLA
ncbi:MAG: twin-arginine translocase subunit TatC [Acidobacteriota bacterium]|jgi:sec-independent protein translocase protein TatC|nr:twin-arginine translocase subunit TatC [Acidobacteriota bacterium]NLT32099.1 twin-arginine translocase subunit TatC [Acidobacteriota bacterium]